MLLRGLIYYEDMLHEAEPHSSGGLLIRAEVVLDLIPQFDTHHGTIFLPPVDILYVT